MLFSSFSALLLATALPTSVFAKQTFGNTGTRTGWDDFTHEHKGTVQQVSNVVYRGDQALKMTQVYDTDYQGRYHSEAVKWSVYREGDAGFYGFAFRLQEDWEFTASTRFNLAQFIADFSDLGCGETWMPGAMIYLRGDGLAARVKTGRACPVGAQETTGWEGLARVSAGAWHTVVVQASWRSDAGGLFRVWFDGALVHDEGGIPTTVADDRAFDFRVGLYANGWHDDGYEGSQPTRSVWFDQIGVGSEMGDADPARW
jgi:hypothetical protein